jgi:hypothetical protein
MEREAYRMMYRTDGGDFRRVDLLRSSLRREDEVTWCLRRALENEEYND